MDTEKSSAEGAPQEGGETQFTQEELGEAREKLVKATSEEVGEDVGNQWDLDSLGAKPTGKVVEEDATPTETPEERQKKIIADAMRKYGSARSDAREADSGSWTREDQK